MFVAPCDSIPRSVVCFCHRRLLVHKIHYRTHFRGLHPDRSDFKTATDLVELQTHLLRMGYAVVFRDDNGKCRHCTELTLMRIHCPNTGVYSNMNLAEVI